ncbi:MAG: EAL domain-containing protein [Metallibacterium sp.]
MRSSGAPEALPSPKREGAGVLAEPCEGIPTETVAVPGFEPMARSVARVLKAPLVSLILTDGGTLWYAAEEDRRAQSSLHPPHRLHAEVAHWRVPHVVLDTLAEAHAGAAPADGLPPPAPIRFFASTPVFMLTGRQAGALCVMDFTPRVAIGEEEATALHDAAVLAGTGIVLRRYISTLDPVTQLPHRGAFFEDLHAWLSQQSEGLTLAVIEVAPVDRYNAFLRAMGHVYSDTLMYQASARLRAWAMSGARLYQVGVQRFAVLMPRLPVDARATQFDPLIARLREPLDCLGIPLLLQPSARVIDLPTSGPSGDDVLRSALTAAHSAHRELRGWIRSTTRRRLRASKQDFFLVTELATALHSGTELGLHYQPRIDLHTGHCRSAEALARWRHPTLGYISPSRFVPMAERSALMRTLTEWVFEQAFAQWAAWRRSGQDIDLSLQHLQCRFRCTRESHVDVPLGLLTEQRHAA